MKSKWAGRAALLAVLLLIPALSLADGAWTTLTETEISAVTDAAADAGTVLEADGAADTDTVTDPDAAPAVSGYTGEVRMTFLGDCTLGGEEKQKNSRLGFQKRVEENGYAFPFRNLLRLTGNDDLTVANLEGVLSDRKLSREKKKYNFIGPAAYTEILKLGEIECVTLANNHSHDYGDEGYADTREALEKAGIAWFGTDAPAVWENGEGLKIGFVGVSYSLTGNRFKRYEAQVRQLQAQGCAAVITVMHAGKEYSYTPPSNYQKQIVQRAVQCGSCLIIGHHPHVVQGFTLYEGVPVVYSLGNCSFGATTYAKDSDALAVQAVLCFRDGALEKTELHFYPISITSDDHYNNYSPRLLTGKDAERVLKKMRKSTGMDPGEWNEETGAAVTVTP